MSRLLRAELLKVRSTRVVYGLIAGTLAFTALAVVSTIATAGRNDTFNLATSEGVRNAFNGAAAGGVLMVVLGILGITTEFRYGTIVPTLLVTPARPRVVRAKVGAFAVLGLLLAVLNCLLVVAIAVPWLSAKDVNYSLFGPDVLPVLIGSVIAYVLYGILGVGVGTLIHNQVVAIVVTLVWMLVAEALLVGLVPSVGKWLPGGAAAGLTNAASTRGEYLPMWAGAALLAAYGVVLTAIGTRLMVKRDII